jgi:hypothetical protein
MQPVHRVISPSSHTPPGELGNRAIQPEMRLEAIQSVSGANSEYSPLPRPVRKLKGSLVVQPRAETTIRRSWSTCLTHAESLSAVTAFNGLSSAAAQSYRTAGVVFRSAEQRTSGGVSPRTTAAAAGPGPVPKTRIIAQRSGSEPQTDQWTRSPARGFGRMSSSLATGTRPAPCIWGPTELTLQLKRQWSLLASSGRT